MALAQNNPITDIDGLKTEGGQMNGSPSLPAVVPATLTTTANFPARLASAGPQPRYFEVNITAAGGAWTLTFQHPTGATAWVNGDECGVVSPATLANAVTVQDITGPTTLSTIPTTAGGAFRRYRYNGAAFVAIAGGSMP